MFKTHKLCSLLICPCVPFTVQIGASAQAEDNTAIYVMNNYFGIGIDADLCLGKNTLAHLLYSHICKTMSMSVMM